MLTSIHICVEQLLLFTFIIDVQGQRITDFFDCPKRCERESFSVMDYGTQKKRT